jgi:lipoprotein-anchoring transpeptidase ErfK/SrfK
MRGAARTIVAGAGIAAVTIAATATAAEAPPVQRGVRLDVPVNVHVKPNQRSRTIARIETFTPATLRAAVYPVVSSEVAAAGKEWLRVRLPMRPNGATGWIPARVTKPVALPWRIRISLHNRLASVYRNGRVVRRFRVVVGAPRTPTPRGHFYVVERVKLHTSWARGLWALALSAHSERLKHFEGGDGQVALHARGSLSAPLGTAASHGCIRVADRTIAWLASRVPRGTPVDIDR